MKIRFKGNSVRLRLNQSEVRAILDGKKVVEKTDFPGATLRFELHAEAGMAEKIHAELADHCLQITINAAMASAWTDPACVGFSHPVPLKNGDVLRVLIEKDFACLDRQDQEPDAFPNPNACQIIGP